LAKLPLFLAVLALGACGEEPEADVVAHVGDWTLSESELAELIVLAQPFPLDPGAVEDLARHWIGAAALMGQVAAGDDMNSAEAVSASTWLERREALLAAEREGRLGLTPMPEPEAAFEAGDLRLLAHVLRRVGPETSEAERDLQQRTAERILAALIAGGAWDDAVAESQDPETRDASGLLGLVGPGELPASLDRAAARLEAGQVSSVIQSPEGYHILYRPRYEEVAGLFASRMRERRLAEADAASSDRLLSRRGLMLAPDVTTALRRVAADPLAALDSDATMASWAEGALEEGVVARYVVGLPPGARAEMAEATDRALRAFLQDVALRELRVQDAEATGLELEDHIGSQLARQHAEELEFWMTSLGMAEGRGATRADLDRYMEDMVSRQVEARSLPPLFEAWLLGRVDWMIRPEGIAGAIDGARAMLVGVAY
jgi:hypothetical protein